MIDIYKIYRGDIAVTKDGKEYRVNEVDSLDFGRSKVRINLTPIENIGNPLTCNFEYAWVGLIEQLDETFVKIGEWTLGTDKEIEKTISKLFNKLAECVDELTELEELVKKS